MTKRRHPLLIGNWKMNPSTLTRAVKIWSDLQKNLIDRNGASQIVVAPPLPFLPDLAELAGAQKIALVAQDVSRFSEGAHTGEVSASQIKSLGVKCAIIGHSERRAAGESNEVVNEKLVRLMEAGLTAVLCVGERERDTLGSYFNVVETELNEGLKGLKADQLKNLIVAYEPVWAIGTGKNATPENVEEMKLFIQKVLFDLYGREAAGGVRVLYGGSVDPSNAEELLKGGGVDGFLIGGASLDAKRFAAIINLADQYARMA